MTTTQSPLALRQRLDASNWTHRSGVEDWVSDLRRICVDNLTGTGLEQRRSTLKERLFPLTSGSTLTMRDVLYSEGLWSAGTLVTCFAAFALFQGSLMGAISFMLTTALTILPLLVIWAALGYLYVRKREHHSRLP